jgi:Leucine-rich repeat (LRR) protein
MKTTTNTQTRTRIQQFALILLVSMGIHTVTAQVSSQQREALVDIYNETNGAEWNKSWDLTAAVSTWSGVTVIDNKVVALSLINNNLNGTLPASIGQLTDLATLNLHNNKLKGAVPNSLGNIKTLKSLNLSLNQFQGLLPITLVDLSNLEHLDIYFNDFNGDLSAITRTMKKLSRLTSFGNDFLPVTSMAINTSIQYQHIDIKADSKTASVNNIKQRIQEVKTYHLDRPTSKIILDKGTSTQLV